MNYFWKTCLIAVLLLPAQTLYALDLFANGSYWEKDDADGTWGIGLGAALPLFSEHLRLDGRFYLFESTDAGEDDLDLIPLDFGLQIHILPDKELDPYILGGISYIYADADRSDVDSEFGGYLGAGLDFQLTSNLKLFGELLYRSAEVTSEFGKFDEDIDISGFTANTGLKIHF